MSLLTLVASKFGRRYDRGAAVVDAETIRAELLECDLFVSASVFLKDGAFLCLEAGRLEDFLTDQVWTTGIRYDARAFDCDDFAAAARGEILRAGYANGFSPSIFVAEACHWPADGSVYHDAILLRTNRGQYWLYQPESGKIQKDLTKAIRSVGEVWG